MGRARRGAAFPVLEKVDDGRGDRWLRLLRPGERTGWVRASDGLEAAEAVRLRREATLLIEPDPRGERPRALRAGTVVEIVGRADRDGVPWVRARQPRGRDGLLPGDAPVADLRPGKAGHTYDPFDALAFATEWLARRGMAGGAVLTAVSLAWLGAGLALGRLFYAPVVTAGIGAVTMLAAFRREPARAGPALEFVPRGSRPTAPDVVRTPTPRDRPPERRARGGPTSRPS